MYTVPRVHLVESRYSKRKVICVHMYGNKETQIKTCQLSKIKLKIPHE